MKTVDTQIFNRAIKVFDDNVTKIKADLNESGIEFHHMILTVTKNMEAAMAYSFSEESSKSLPIDWFGIFGIAINEFCQKQHGASLEEAMTIINMRNEKSK